MNLKPMYPAADAIPAALQPYYTLRDGAWHVNLEPSESAPPAPVSPPIRFPQAQGESDRAYEAFRVYLELGPARRHAAVARRVGASLRTVKRWAADFDWRGRLEHYVADAAEAFVETEQAAQREELLEAGARARDWRDRQYALAHRLLDTAERYLERVDDSDLDWMSLGDACKALEVASRLGQQAERGANEAAPDAAHALRDQITTLLEQVFAEHSTKSAGQPTPSAMRPTDSAS